MEKLEKFVVDYINHGDYNIAAEFILDKGVNPNITSTRTNVTTLMKLIQTKQEFLAFQMLALPTINVNQKDVLNNTAYFYAACSATMPLLEKMIENPDFDPNEVNHKKLNMAMYFCLYKIDSENPDQREISFLHTLIKQKKLNYFATATDVGNLSLAYLLALKKNIPIDFLTPYFLFDQRLFYVLFL